jgi:hypothetical protein
MNPCLSLTLLVALSLLGPVAAHTNQQQPKTVTEPQYINSFYSVDSAGILTELERQSVSTFHTKTRALPGYATVKMLAEFKPGHSSVRLSPDARFLVKGRIPSIDPASRFELRLLKASKDHREILMTQGHATLLSGSATSKLDEGALPVRFEEYGADSYRITPMQPLAAGEYALGSPGFVTQLFCFGVDR